MRQSKINFKRPLLYSFIWLACSVFLTNCTKEKRTVDSSSGAIPLTGASNLSSIQSDIFQNGCTVSGCHDNRPNPAGSLNLSNANLSFSGMVNKKSLQATHLNMVTPNDPAASYLINKLEGTHLQVGGSGDRMPQYAAPLSASDFNRIVDWINNGAPND